VVVEDMVAEVQMVVHHLEMVQQVLVEVVTINQIILILKKQFLIYLK
jgi:hypothetical protein